MYRNIGKRIFDLTAASLAIIVLWPLLLGTALVVRLRLGSPVLFQQKRVGRNSQIFSVQKFRSMTDARDAQGELLADEIRLTPTGKFLRAASLDELPQLFNVIRGEMSLVGPRPLLVEYLPRYNSHQARRHEVRPGITGWAQVNGRNSVGWEDRFNFDVHYVDNYNVWFDMKILGLTLLKVFQRSGVNSDNHATMERFQGTAEPKASSNG